MRLNVEVLEGRYALDATPGDAQPDPDAGLRLLAEIQETVRVAQVAALGGALYAGVTFVPPPPNVPFLPSDLILPDPVPVKP